MDCIRENIGSSFLDCWWIATWLAITSSHPLGVVISVVFFEVGLQVRKGTGFVPVSDLPSDDEEEDEQVGGPFANDFKCRFYRQSFFGKMCLRPFVRKNSCLPDCVILLLLPRCRHRDQRAA